MPWPSKNASASGGDPGAARQSGEQKVSVDILRHPLSSRARRLLQKALALAQAGDHAAAIQSLQETMAQQPSSVPYGHVALGIEYIRTGRYQSALTELEQATALMPHEAGIHSNLALSLWFLGQFDRAEEEIRRALVLDPTIPHARKLFEALLARKETLAK